jgi:hypothetical protein
MKTAKNLVLTRKSDSEPKSSKTSESTVAMMVLSAKAKRCDLQKKHRRLKGLSTPTVVIGLFVTLLGGVLNKGNAQEPHRSSTTLSETPRFRINDVLALGDTGFNTHNTLAFSLTTAEAATDNVSLNGTTESASDTYTIIAPRLGYHRQYQRVVLSFDYRADGLIYNRYRYLSRIAQYGGFDISFALTPRLSMALVERGTAAPESNFNLSPRLNLDPLASGILPNNSLVLTRTNSYSNTAQWGLSYQISRRSDWNIGVVNSLARFDINNLTKVNRYGANLGYTYRVSSRATLDLAYWLDYYDLTNSPTGSETAPHNSIVRNHSALAGVSYLLRPGVRAFANAGPIVTIGDTLNVGGIAGNFFFRRGVHPRVNGGIDFGKEFSLDPKTIFSLTLDQNVCDAFGTGSIVLVQRVGGSVGRRLARRTTVAVSGGYARNKFLVSSDYSGVVPVANGTFVNASFRQSLSDRFSIYANYSYTKQRFNEQVATIPTYLTVNVLSLGIQYSLPKYF